MAQNKRNQIVVLLLICHKALSSPRLTASARNTLLVCFIAVVSLLETGCRSTDIKPIVSAGSTENGAVEGRIGFTVGGQESKEEVKQYPVGHGGFWKELGNAIRSPLYIYRCSDGKWFPEWREHPVEMNARCQALTF